MQTPQLVSSLAARTGVPDSKVRTGLNAATGAIMDGLANKAGEPRIMSEVTTLVDQTPDIDDVSLVLDDGTPIRRSANRLLGLATSDMPSMLERLGGAVGIGRGAMSTIVGAAAGLVMGGLRTQRRARGGLDAPTLSAVLGEGAARAPLSSDVVSVGEPISHTQRLRESDRYTFRKARTNEHRDNRWMWLLALIPIALIALWLFNRPSSRTDEAPTTSAPLVREPSSTEPQATEPTDRAPDISPPTTPEEPAFPSATTQHEPPVTGQPESGLTVRPDDQSAASGEEPPTVAPPAAAGEEAPSVVPPAGAGQSAQPGAAPSTTTPQGTAQPVEPGTDGGPSTMTPPPSTEPQAGTAEPGATGGTMTPTTPPADTTAPGATTPPADTTAPAPTTPPADTTSPGATTPPADTAEPGATEGTMTPSTPPADTTEPGATEGTMTPSTPPADTAEPGATEGTMTPSTPPADTTEPGATEGTMTPTEPQAGTTQSAEPTAAGEEPSTTTPTAPTMPAEPAAPATASLDFPSGSAEATLLKEATASGADQKKSEWLVLDAVKFPSGSSEVSDEAADQLSHVAQVLEQNPAVEIELGGYTDAPGSTRVNRQISKARAESVRQALIDKGVEASRIVAKGYGEANPIKATRAQEEANRRVAVRIAKR
jgi:outer membrane protein OmpA-like peptidoglycan-associated protein